MKLLNTLVEQSQRSEYQDLVDKEKDKKVIFKETDPNLPFPEDTVRSLEKEINKKAKDLEKDWKSASELVDSVFSEFDVPKPSITHPTRWDQYKDLLEVAVKDLYEARGNINR